MAETKVCRIKKAYGDNEKAIEVILLHFCCGKRLSVLDAEAMLHLAALRIFRSRAKEVKEPSVPCGVSFPLFFPLLERKEAAGGRTRHRHSREFVSVSGMLRYLSLSQLR
ncbi:MAG: hypothetical protein J6J83_08140 [Oscillospiraceae bacterium]|nr:hypothetical protein [Oscillospiraceae bacterium]